MFLSTRLLRSQIIPRVLAPSKAGTPGYPNCFQGKQWQQVTRQLGINKFATKATPAVKDTAKKPYDERIIIYYAGRRTVYLATLKLSTLFLFSFCAFIAAPSIGLQTEFGILAPVGIVLAGAIPLVFIQYVSPPYVTHIHLRLPTFARYSREYLMRYAQQIPKDAVIDVITIRLLGRPRMDTFKVGDIRSTRKRLGCVNWEVQQKKKMGYYYVDERGSPSRVPEPDIIRYIAEAVKKQTQAAAVNKTN
ncbi:hypothetical protein RUND412_003764 [Rhizina undulata]